MRRFCVLTAAVGLLALPAAPGVAAPSPGIGLLIKPGDMPALREKLTRPPWSATFAKMTRQVDKALADWPARRDRLAPHLGKLLDLAVSHAKVPADPAVREAGTTLDEFAKKAMCPAAFVYLITGERRYADFAYDVLLHMGKVNRWGWFPWAGTHMPQIHAGMHFRNAAFTLDFLWDALTGEQRRAARDLLAEKAVEPYYRLVLFAPAMGLHHLRCKNQGNNVLAGAVIACLALGEDYPNARRWRRAYLQTLHWVITHDVGWAGQGLESGLPGYWSVSMHNLYTAAACIYNVTGIDLRVHPAFAEATYYPIYHEATVPPVGQFTAPIDASYRGPCGIIAGKPIELPHAASGGPWWYDYARRFADPQAMYFINRTMVGKDRDGQLAFRIHNCHQEGHSDVIGLLWTAPELYRPDAPGPAALFKTTDRMSMVRGGYGMGQTYLYFNGDVFLSSLGEVLCTTGGLSWHYKWHGWQKAETGIETEAEPLAPSMVVKDSWHDEGFSFLHAVSGTSNIRYYRPPGQSDCYRQYRRRDREILYVRDEPGSDYFVFLDRVAQDGPRWHGWLWQSWNHVHQNLRANYGRYRVEGDRRVRLERPNADLAIDFVAPQRVAFEVESAPGQPIVSYMYDHNLLTLRALAGGYGPAGAGTLVVPPSAWKGAGQLSRPAEVGVDAPEAAYRLAGEKQIKDPANGFDMPAKLAAGTRYRMRLSFRKQDLRVYENLAWHVEVELLDAKGSVLARDADPQDPARPREYNRPGSFRLADPRSLTPTTPWLQTEYVHFDVPADVNVARVRGRLVAATWSHPPSKIHEGSVLEIGPIAFEPAGTVQRGKAETFLAVVSPVAKGAAGPAVVREMRNGATVATIRRPGRPEDRLVLGEGREAVFPGGKITAELALLRQGAPLRLFARGATAVVLAGREVLRASRPVDVSLRVGAGGAVSWAKVKAAAPTELRLSGRATALRGGVFLLAADGTLVPDPAGSALETNGPANQKRLAEGLGPLIAEAIAERDAYVRDGWANLALGAKVTASATRDRRFDPNQLIDSRTWEYPTDGLLDYTQGDLRTSPNGGYGREGMRLSGEDMSVWPFYVRPTYWLLPFEQGGWVQLELPKETDVSLVRLLNTSNAGLNDHATMKYRVELRDAAGKVTALHSGAFGECLDRPFRQAFRYPELFSSYGATFRGMLEPGIPVPFGDGWHEVRFDAARAKLIRVYVDSWWALGGGLNEVQVYSRPGGPAAPAR
ncbi:MAG TPA: hypothetical protein VM695_03770 [Phycisphaerae bacterium]|nr:hypothetical protein [Phycisphaerae bacterium]